MSRDICRLSVDVRYDRRVTDPDSLAVAMDVLLRTAVSTPGILDEHGDPEAGQFVAAAPTHVALVTGDESAADLAARLVAASAWFGVTPMPDGMFAFEVRREPAVVALVQRHLAGREEEKEARRG